MTPLRSDIQWADTMPPADEASVCAVEKACHIKFVDEFKELLGVCDGGIPSKRRFQTASRKNHEIDTFLSVNSSAPEGRRIVDVYSVVHDKYGSKYVPFAVDTMGNQICFDSGSRSIFCMNGIAGVVDLVAFNFNMFMESLY